MLDMSALLRDADMAPNSRRRDNATPPILKSMLPRSCHIFRSAKPISATATLPPNDQCWDLSQPPSLFNFPGP